MLKTALTCYLFYHSFTAILDCQRTACQSAGRWIGRHVQNGKESDTRRQRHATTATHDDSASVVKSCVPMCRLFSRRYKWEMRQLSRDVISRYRMRCAVCLSPLPNDGIASIVLPFRRGVLRFSHFYITPLFFTLRGTSSYFSSCAQSPCHCCSSLPSIESGSSPL